MELSKLTQEQQELVEDAYMLGYAVGTEITESKFVNIRNSDFVNIVKFLGINSKIQLWPVRIVLLNYNLGTIGIKSGYRQALRKIFRNEIEFEQWLDTLAKGEIDDSSKDISESQESSSS